MLVPISSLKTVTKLLLVLMMGSGDKPPYTARWSPEPMFAPDSLLDHDYILSQLPNGYYQLQCAGIDESIYFSPYQLSEVMSFLNNDERTLVEYSENGLEKLAEYIVSKHLMYLGTDHLPDIIIGNSSSSSDSQSRFTWQIGVRIRPSDTHAQNTHTETITVRMRDIVVCRESGDIKGLRVIKQNLELMARVSSKDPTIAQKRVELLMEAEKSLIDLGYLSARQLQQDRALLRNGDIKAFQARLTKVTDILDDKGKWSDWRRSWHGGSWYYGKFNLKVEQYYLQGILNDSVGQLLQVIAEGDVQKARDSMASLNSQWSALDADERKLIEKQVGFHPIRIADLLVSKRSDHAIITMPHPTQAMANTDLIFVPIEQQVAQILDNSSNMQLVGVKLHHLADNLFTQCSNTEFYNPEIETAVYESIQTISTTTSPHEFIMHVAMVEQILSDINAKIQNQPTLAQRAPQLLGRALCKFFMGLNPITQTIDGVMSLVHLGQFAATITVGDWYLSPEEYESRMNEYAKTWNALSYENLQKLTLEQWVDIGAQMAANLFYARVGIGGISKTLRYLKGIEAMAKAQGQATQVFNKMIRAIDGAIGKNPLVVTAEGLVMRMSDGIEKVGKGAKEIIKDSKSFLNSTQIAQQIAKETPEILKTIRPALENLAECGRKIKKIYDYNKINISHIFSPKHIDSGLLSIGKTRSEIMHKLIDVIKKADALDVLREGSTNLLTYIDKIPIEIRVFMKGDTLMGIDGFVGHSARGLKHGIWV